MINGGNVMKKKLLSLLSVSLALVLLCATLFTGCFDSDGSNQTYIIQYTDESGTHTLEVQENMPYSLESIPSKTGYDFMGLYDAEVDGTQYVSANGSSLSSFTDKKNMVLFPQFKAKEYTVILDYQGAAVSGSRQLTVSYGSSLPELPTNLQLEHSDFTGWYTQEGCNGTKVADKYGLIPLVSLLNETNFNLSGNSPIYLYAGFETTKYTVTFHFTQDLPAEEMQVSYNTPISQVIPTTRNNNGEAVLTWSKTQNGTAGENIFSGKVTGNMDLYAVEWAPVIEFDSNGGSDVNPIVAKAGSTVSLPSPTKDLAKFMYWETTSGNQTNITTMPSKSTKLKAVWQAKIVFDANGGTDVDYISEKAGIGITLPTTEKEGYIFAGWYKADKDQYTSTTMPSAGIMLKAGWYKTKQEIVTWIQSSSSACRWLSRASTSDLCYGLSFLKRIPENKYVYITLNWHVKIKHDETSSLSGYADIYTQKTISSAYLIEQHTFNNVTNSYKTFTFSSMVLVNDDFYICFYMNGHYMYLSDFYADVTYPDITTLYL
jgi:hypothetical protein